MKRTLTFIIAAALLISIMTGCAPAMTKNDRLTVVTTIFPEYDWTRRVLGDRLAEADLIMLLDSGSDLHSYQPTAEDMVRLSTCDLFIYVGGQSDGWVDDALREAVNPDMIVLDLMEVLGDAVKEEETVEGMEEDEDGDEEEYDEHIWLSLRNARLITAEIAAALGKIDPENAEIYSENANNYALELTALDEKYSEAVSGGKRDVLLFADRFPFRYMTDDYGLNYYAAFADCSAETEASFETVIFLAEKINELALTSVLTIESSDGRLAETVIANTEAKNARILKMDSMQSVTAADVAAGSTYLGIMEENLAVLKAALS